MTIGEKTKNDRREHERESETERERGRGEENRQEAAMMCVCGGSRGGALIQT